MSSSTNKEAVLDSLRAQYDIGFIEHFQQNGAMAYLHGGAPRDMIMGKKWKDADICICFPAEAGDKDSEAERIFALSGIEVQSKTPLGHDKTVFRFKDKQSGGLIDVRVVNDIWAGGADFTVNALRYDLQTGEFIDKYNSIPDIQNRVIRTLGEADAAFDEENFLLLRAVKAACQLGFELDPEVRAAMKKYAWKLGDNINFIIDDNSDFAEWVLSNLFAGLKYNPELYYQLMREVKGIEIFAETLARRIGRQLDELEVVESLNLKSESSLEVNLSLLLSHISQLIDRAEPTKTFNEIAALLKITRPKQGDDFDVDIRQIEYVPN